MTTLLLLAVLAALAVPVEGATSCPTPAEVSRELGGLRRAGDSDPPARVRLDDDGRAVTVTIAGPDGTFLVERRLERGPPCSELASAAALIVAAWRSDVHPQYPAARAVVGPSTTTEEMEAARVTTAAGSAPARAPRSTVDLGIALLGSATPHGTGAQTAAGMLLEVRHHAGGRDHRWWLRAVLLGTTTREELFASGGAIWRRTALGAGVGARLISMARSVGLEVHADVMAAWLSVRGTGFAPNLRDDALDPAMGAGARLTLGAAAGPRWVRPWLEVGSLVWPRPQTVFEEPGGNSARLPRWEVYLALGASFAPRGGP